jgi:CheY-like chemotaxis protein
MGAQRIHVLVVDDLTDAAESAAEMLILWGFDVIACDSGAKALACARLRPPDAVVLDLLMPQMDGFQFAEACRTLPGCNAVPLVAVSGYWSAAYEARAREAGIVHYLIKPVYPTLLRAVLRAVTCARTDPAAPKTRKRPGVERFTAVAAL